MLKYSGKTNDIKMANRSFENVARFKYLETTITNKKMYSEEN
jgi:hypothetical protein